MRGTRPAAVWRVARPRAVTIRRLLTTLSILAGLAGLAGCRATSGATALTAGSEPTGAEAAWPVVLIAAASDVDQGRHAEADKALREFAAEHARSPEALESTYWRAVFMLDPANTTATPREAGVLLEGYLASNAPLAHRAEATVLQRVVKSLTASREAGSAAPPRASEGAREAEIKALKDELEQTKAELERIKKRVAPPPPPATPPPTLPDAE